MATVKDLVCGMDVDTETAAATSEYQGRTYYFCAPGCKKQFDRDPERYIGKRASDEEHGDHHG
jgi:Cu+-exporting ATPase